MYADKQTELLSLWEMRQVETIEQFYKRKFNWVPENLQKELGHLMYFG